MKKLLTMLLALTMVFALVACSGNGGGETTPATEEEESEKTMPNYGAYVKDEKLYLVKHPDGTPVKITKHDVDSVMMTADGKTIFYRDDGDLFYQDTAGEKDSTKINSDVIRFAISADGQKVVYLKGGNLYAYDMKDSTKIASDIMKFWVTEDCNTILYTGSSAGKVALYKKIGSQDPVKLISGEDISLEECTDDLSAVLLTVDGDLYQQSGSKEAEKIAGNAYVESGYYDGAFYYTVPMEPEASGYNRYILYYYTGKESVEIASGVFYTGDYSQEKAMILYCTVEDDVDSFYLATKDKVSEIKVNGLYTVRLKEDGTAVLLMRDVDGQEGQLYEAAIFDGEVQERKGIGEDVYVNSFGYVNGKIYYYADKEQSEGTLYIDGAKIHENAVVGQIAYLEDLDVVIYATDQNDSDYTFTLWYLKDGRSYKIAEEIFQISYTPAGCIMLLTERDGDGEGILYLFDGKECVKIDEGVSGINYITVPDGVYSAY